MSQTDYIREYYRKRRARLYAEAPDPETHPLRIWRKEHGLSMAATGRLLGVSDAAVWQWERDLVPTPEWVTEIIRGDLSDYVRRKLREADADHAEQLRTNPLRQWRLRRGYSLPQAERELGIPKSTLIKWEHGSRTIPGQILQRLEAMT